MSTRITLEAYSTEIPCYEVLSLAVHIPAPAAANPFADAALSGVFTQESGPAVTVKGFCDADDGSLWRLRFCPRRTGAYRFTLRYQDSGGSVQVEGSFVCRPGSGRGFVHVDPDHPYHLVCDNGEHVFLAGKTAWRLGVAPQWKEFLDQCARFRQNVVRCAVEGILFDFLPGGTIWPWQGTRAERDFRRFNLEAWRHWDEVVTYAARLGIYVEPVVFATLWQEPAPAIPSADMERYWDYMMARLGAYPNILLWELFNEFTGHVAFQGYMARYLHMHDAYGRIVTASGREIGDIPFPEADWNDLMVPHFCTGSWNSLKNFYHDWATRLHRYDRPVYIDETGRLIPEQNNWDGEHRRKQYWLWAMAGDYCNYHSQGGCYTDLTLEPGEEYWPAYVGFWEATRWWQMTPADQRVIAAPPDLADTCCLWSPDETIVYLYVPTGEKAQGGALYLNLNGGLFRVRWYHPKTGAWQEEGHLEHPGGPALITIPPFSEDLALHLTHVVASPF